MPKRQRRSEYDVCLSFAGENREYVEAVAKDLQNRAIAVFYDEWERARLWGKDLYREFSRIYRDSARYCVIFVSTAYARKVWPNHELRNAQARALTENAEYILPARFDKTKLPGVLDTVFYVDLRRTSPAELAKLIVAKIGLQPRENFLPPEPDQLFRRMRANTPDAKSRIDDQAQEFFGAWQHLKPRERRVISELVVNGCPGELPDLIHCALDRLERYSGVSAVAIKRIFPFVADFGFDLRIRKLKRSPGVSVDDVTFRYHIMDRRHRKPQTNFACAMILGATRGFCAEHGIEALLRSDFGQLASVNEAERHAG